MIKRNIVILPPPEITKRAIEWSQQVAKKYQTDFILDGKNFYPHITLFQGEYPDEKLTILEENLGSISRSTSPIHLRVRKFSSYEGFIFLEVEKDDALVALHKKVFSAAAKLGKSLSPLAGKTFVPHISITRLRQPEKALALLGRTDNAFEARSLYLANIGIDGSVNEIYREFPLQMV